MMSDVSWTEMNLKYSQINQLINIEDSLYSELNQEISADTQTLSLHLHGNWDVSEPERCCGPLAKDSPTHLHGYALACGECVKGDIHTLQK